MMPTPKVAATVDKMTVDTELGKTETLTLTVTGTDGFAGDVTIQPTVVDSAGNPLTGWTLTANPATLTLSQNGTMTSMVSVKIPTDAAELAPIVKLAVSSTAPAVEADSALTVKKQVTLTFDAGAGTAAPHQGLPQPNSRLMIRAGTKVIFHNGDTIPHRIHGDGGITHEPSDLAPGGDYAVTVNADADWYCHDHENSNADVRLVSIVQ